MLVNHQDKPQITWYLLTGYFSSVQPRLCATISLFQRSSWREGSRPLWAMWPLTYLEVQPDERGEGSPCLEGKKAPVLREQLCPLKRVAGLHYRLISNRRRGVGNCLEYTGAAKGVTPWGHPRQNIISMNEGGASSCFVHYVLCT